MDSDIFDAIGPYLDKIHRNMEVVGRLCYAYTEYGTKVIVHIKKYNPNIQEPFYSGEAWYREVMPIPQEEVDTLVYTGDDTGWRS